MRCTSRDSAHIYNDDSKLEEAVGIGIYSNSIGIFKSMRLLDHCSVFLAEVSAIQVEFQILVDKNVHKRKITILSDYPADIEALDSCAINSKTVYNCRRCLKANQY